MEYHFSKKVGLPFAKAIERTTEELQKQGFGIITTIDMKKTFKNKLNVDFRNYTILGACNPEYACKGLSAEDKLGVLLPCNVVVQEHDNGEVEISMINPEEMVLGIDSPEMKVFAGDVKESLLEAFRNI